MQQANSPTPDAESQQPSRAYANYVLGVLVIVYIFNLVDRQILSILAEDIKADLGITDAQMGFLYGTVFAVFYAVFGIPLARFADVWVRRSLISMGLVVWSAMTALSGTAGSFWLLASYRVGVGIGEASASPAAYSMLSDYYPPRLRATVISIYSAGNYIGGGLGLILGGLISDRWNRAYAEIPAPYDLRGWQVAFFCVGIPGIVMAIWVRTLREPVRGISEGLVTPKHPTPWRVLWSELASMLPPMNLGALIAAGATGRVLLLNAAAALGIVLTAYGLIVATGDIAQWVALGLGLYVSVSWAQVLRLRDYVTYAMIFKSRAMIYVMLGFSTMAFVGYGVGFWTAPLLQRSLGATAAQVGTGLGIGSAVGGFVGVTLGGYLSDKFKQRWAAGRLLVGFMVVIGSIPLVLVMVNTQSLMVAFISKGIFAAFISSYIGIPPSTAADLVMPRMRAVAGAYFLMLTTFIGGALGPYTVGKLSDQFALGGMSEGDALRLAMSCALLMFVASVVFLALGWRHLPSEEAGRVERARGLGEAV